MYIKQQTNMNISVIKKYGLMAVAMMIVVHGMTSCDDHGAIDTNIHVGHVLCSDGNVLTADDCKKQGKEPVAIVFYTSKDNNDNGEGLAVGLDSLVLELSAHISREIELVFDSVIADIEQPAGPRISLLPGQDIAEQLERAVELFALYEHLLIVGPIIGVGNGL